MTIMNMVGGSGGDDSMVEISAKGSFSITGTNTYVSKTTNYKEYVRYNYVSSPSMTGFKTPAAAFLTYQSISYVDPRTTSDGVTTHEGYIDPSHITADTLGDYLKSLCDSDKTFHASMYGTITMNGGKLMTGAQFTANDYYTVVADGDSSSITYTGLPTSLLKCRLWYSASGAPPVFVPVSIQITYSNK